MAAFEKYAWSRNREPENCPRHMKKSVGTANVQASNSGAEATRHLAITRVVPSYSGLVPSCWSGWGKRRNFGGNVLQVRFQAR
jgi:hypothetical protein